MNILLYLVVGASATVVEWISFYLLCNLAGLNYLLATAIAFIFSTFANWLVGKIILFKATKNIIKEILQVYFASVMGMLFNMIIMYICVDIMYINEMLSKIVATMIVFAWNYAIRKLYIYKSL